MYGNCEQEAQVSPAKAAGSRAQARLVELEGLAGLEPDDVLAELGCTPEGLTSATPASASNRPE